MTFQANDFAIFEPVRNVNYGPQDLDSARDREIRELLLKVKDRTAFDQFKQLMPRDADSTLSAFAERAASLTVRHQDARELRVGLLAATIALSVSTDYREVLPTLALLHRACEMIGKDPNSEFLAMDVLLGGAAHDLIDFLQRTPEDKSIAAMAYEEGDDKDGFRFRRNW
jgi:hypothetical protein